MRIENHSCGKTTNRGLSENHLWLFGSSFTALALNNSIIARISEQEKDCRIQANTLEKALVIYLLLILKDLRFAAPQILRIKEEIFASFPLQNQAIKTYVHSVTMNSQQQFDPECKRFSTVGISMQTYFIWKNVCSFVQNTGGR